MINGMVFDIGPFLRDEADKTVGKCWGRFYMCATCTVGMSTLLRRNDESEGVSTWESHGISILISVFICHWLCRQGITRCPKYLILFVFKIEPRQNIQAGKQSYCGNWNCRDLGRWCFQRILVTESTEDWNRCWWSLCSPDISVGLCNTRHVVVAICCFSVHCTLC